MSASARMDFRLPGHAKSKIERAAELRGVSTTAYAIETMTRQADSDIRSHEQMQLDAEETRALIASLSEPFRSHERLAKALARHEREGL